MANVIKRESKRTYETVSLGVIKTNASTGAAEGPGAASVSFTANVIGGATATGSPPASKGLLTNVSSFTNLQVGAELVGVATEYEDANKIVKLKSSELVSSGTTILELNSTAKTVTLSQPIVQYVGTETEEGTGHVSKGTFHDITGFEFTAVEFTALQAVVFTGAETKTFEVYGPNYDQAEYLALYVNIVEATEIATAKVKFGLETTFDSGKSWVALAASETTELTATGATLVKFNVKESDGIGSRVRLFAKAAAKGKVSGYVVLNTDHSPFTSLG